MTGLTGEESRPDIRARGVWRKGQNAYFDMRITDCNTVSQKNKSLEKIMKTHEADKKRQYNNIIMNIEHGTYLHAINICTKRRCRSRMRKVSPTASWTYRRENREQVRSHRIVDSMQTFIYDFTSEPSLHPWKSIPQRGQQRVSCGRFRDCVRRRTFMLKDTVIFVCLFLSFLFLLFCGTLCYF